MQWAKYKVYTINFHFKARNIPLAAAGLLISAVQAAYTCSCSGSYSRVSYITKEMFLLFWKFFPPTLFFKKVPTLTLIDSIDLLFIIFAYFISVHYVKMLVER